MKRLIRLSSRALGDLVRVRVYIYDDADEMRRAAAAFTGDLGCLDPEAQGFTQAWTTTDGRAGLCTMRLARDHLGVEVITHEMHHATAALYGATLPDTINAREILSHFNEPFAYLHGELVRKLCSRLYSLGYY